MKEKIFSRIMLAMLLALVGFGFTACGGDDNDEPDTPDTNATWTGMYQISFEIGEDVLSTADVTVHFANPDGTFTSQAVTKSQNIWKSTDSKTPLPQKAGAILTFVPKQNIDASKTYQFKVNASLSAASYKDGKLVHSNSSGHNFHKAVAGNEMHDYLLNHPAGVATGIDAKGEVTALDVKDFDFGINFVF